MRLTIPKMKTPFWLLSKRTAKRNHDPDHGKDSTDAGPEQVEHGSVSSHEPASLSSSRLFEHQKSAITELSRAALLDYSIIDGLGIDASSEYFMQRKKSIAYAIVIKGQVFCLQTNWFLQPAKYNDFSGGYKRSYKLLPEALVRKHLSDFILSFHRKFNLPDGAIILLQLQQSIVETGASGDKSTRCSSNANDITGQGIHTDGLDCAAILCIERTNVNGALNSLYADLDGETTLLEPTTLCEGDALFFQDNSLYHYVSDAQPIDTSEDLKRTVLIAHYPSHVLLTGKENPRNSLRRKESLIKLRQSSFNSDGYGTENTIGNTEHRDEGMSLED